MNDFTFKQNVDGTHEVIEVDAGMMKQGILKVLRTVATFDDWHEAMVCTKALIEQEEKDYWDSMFDGDGELLDPEELDRVEEAAAAQDEGLES